MEKGYERIAKEAIEPEFWSEEHNAELYRMIKGVYRGLSENGSIIKNRLINIGTGIALFGIKDEQKSSRYLMGLKDKLKEGEMFPPRLSESDAIMIITISCLYAGLTNQLIVDRFKQNGEVEVLDGVLKALDKSQFLTEEYRQILGIESLVA